MGLTCSHVFTGYGNSFHLTSYVAHSERVLEYFRRTHDSGIVSPTTATSDFVSDLLRSQSLPQQSLSTMVANPLVFGAPNPQSAPSPVVDHSPALSTPRPAQPSGCDRQPRATKRATPYGRRTRATKTAARGNNFHYSDEEIEILLDVAEMQKPFCLVGWAAAEEMFNRECQSRSLDVTRDSKSLETKFMNVGCFSTLHCYTSSCSPELQLANFPKPSGKGGVVPPDVLRAKQILRLINNAAGANTYRDRTAHPPATQNSSPTVRAVKVDPSLSRATPRQPSSKGDEFVSKLTSYLDERSSSSSSSSGINTTLVLMTSQNGELRSQNSELRSQVDRYQMQVDRLEKKLEKLRKKSDMADLVGRLANHSISPQPPSVPDLTQHMLALSTSEQAPSLDPQFQRTPSPGLQSQHMHTPPPDTQFQQIMMPPPDVPVPTAGRVTRYLPDGSEVWYPGNEMPGDFVMRVLNDRDYDPLQYDPLYYHPEVFDTAL